MNFVEVYKKFYFPVGTTAPCAPVLPVKLTGVAVQTSIVIVTVIATSVANI